MNNKQAAHLRMRGLLFSGWYARLDVARYVRGFTKPANEWHYVMRNMIAHFVALLVLLILSATVVAWIRSRYWSDQVGITWQQRTHARTVEIYTTKGSVGAAFIHSIDHRPNYDGEPDTFDNIWQLYAEGQDGRLYYPWKGGHWGGYGFWLNWGDDTPGWRFQNNIRIIEVPIAAVSTMSLAILAAIFWKRWHRSVPGTCSSCGYDLRATPDRCPECGNVAKL